MLNLDLMWLGVRRTINVVQTGRIITMGCPFSVDLSPRLIVPFSRWIRNNGHQWAGQRVKKLKTWAIHLLAGNQSYSEAWIRHHSYKGYTVPRLLIFQELIDSIRSSNLKKIRLILIVLNSYQLIVLGKPSLDSVINASVSADEYLRDYVRKLRIYATLPRVPLRVLDPVESVQTSRSYVDEQVLKPKAGPYGQQRERLLDDLESRYAMEIPLDEPYDPSGEEVWKRFGTARSNPRSRYSTIQASYLGYLMPIVDKGKYRNILVGHRALQLKSKSLANYIRYWLWDQPEVCSGDQRKMEKFAHEQLRNGRTLLSIDLSEATDRFSVKLQVEILLSMGVPEDFLDFLDFPFHYSEKDFGLGSDPKLKEGFFSNGQPMGLFLSFPMFELAHYMILKWVVSGTDSLFCILGDDVLISCRKEDKDMVFSRYTSEMTRFGAKINLNKTIISEDAAEGAGALFLRKYPNITIRTPKGKISTTEAYLKGTGLYQEIANMSTVGRMVHSKMVSSKIIKSYTYEDRKIANEMLVTKDLSHMDCKALRELTVGDNVPRKYNILEESDTRFYRACNYTPDTPFDVAPMYNRFIPIGKDKYLQLLINNKIISLLKRKDLTS